MEFLNDMTVRVNDYWKIVKFRNSLDFNFSTPSWRLSQTSNVPINIYSTILREKLFIQLNKIKCIFPYYFMVLFTPVQMITHSSKETIPISSNLDNWKVIIFKWFLKLKISLENFLLMFHLIIGEFFSWFLRFAKRVFRSECFRKFTNWNNSFWWQLYPFIINILESSIMYMYRIFVSANNSCF